jgi:hypothetical protein
MDVDALFDSFEPPRTEGLTQLPNNREHQEEHGPLKLEL